MYLITDYPAILAKTWRKRICLSRGSYTGNSLEAPLDLSQTQQALAFIECSVLNYALTLNSKALLKTTVRTYDQHHCRHGCAALRWASTVTFDDAANWNLHIADDSLEGVDEPNGSETAASPLHQTFDSLNLWFDGTDEENTYKRPHFIVNEELKKPNFGNVHLELPDRVYSLFMQCVLVWLIFLALLNTLMSYNGTRKIH
ncbi:hypothetical protein F5877DRAFT_70925 [Lentinula edodes]|nr:hypothetical protein F5877DRAFT_70925 [Lentinula edodes]